MSEPLSYPCTAHEVEHRWQSARVPFAEFIRKMRGHPAVRADLSEMFLRASARTPEMAGPHRG